MTDNKISADLMGNILFARKWTHRDATDDDISARVASARSASPMRPFKMQATRHRANGAPLYGLLIANGDGLQNPRATASRPLESATTRQPVTAL
ncbi:hypothetical protein [Bradyrhizobium sp. ERR14]|uniref:hypothetical protein n=1 Tax=Bradyrhizobium sp. ERR14 TaxID=2663837 RepID=UPI00160B78EF|nr:hypothetical protein [Bradyrhizobium sp. ERR14]MBB4398716.1 hypothetical protein [Bradyrhizobium sp. ERR14]